MPMWKRLKSIFLVLSLPATPVVYLNIEKFAERQGWDTVLADLIGTQWPFVLALLEGRLALAVSVAVIAFTVGAWLDWLSRRRGGNSVYAKPPPRQKPHVNIAKTMYDIAREARAVIEFGSWARPNQEAMSKFSGVYRSFSLKIKDLGLHPPEPKNDYSGQDLVNIAQYMEQIAPLVGNSQIKEARALSKELMSGQVPPGTGA